ncbi:MAG: DUF4855 domain-containing protein [Fimbriimonadaceae bacterium]|nr:DUF4855 domain-containing protein [Fimbriimonadaceae bacterium]
MPRGWGLWLLLVTPLRAEYPTPAEAGFHHCALIYQVRQRGPAELAPYVATADRWLFDAFLLLTQRADAGVSLMTGESTRADWESQLAYWFAPGRDLAALDQALASAATRLGPPAPRQVMLSVPYLHHGVRDFGDCDGDGVGEDLRTVTGRETALRWYLQTVQERFAAAGFRHLRLWGGYYMNESVDGADGETARRLGELLHGAGLRYLWIPWYRAAGWDRWRECGFDVAILQPNYAFVSQHRGSIRRNRLAVTAELAREAGMGVEIELPMGFTEPGAARAWRHYLRDGAADRWGYQQAATAYYLGGADVEALSRSADPARRALYDDLVTYVTGRTIAEPDPVTAWQADGRPAASLGDHLLTSPPMAWTVAEARFGEPREVGELDLLLDEPAEAWTGTVTVDSLQGAAWRPAGWALRPAGRERDRRWQVVTVPVGEVTAGLRVRLQGDPGAPPPRVVELSALPAAVGLPRRHLAWQCGYQVRPAAPATYPDAGGELTDGDPGLGGFGSGKSVGWHGDAVAASFDLGAPQTFVAAELQTEGGGNAAVHWPHRAVLLWAVDAPPPTHSAGLGALPQGFGWAPGGPPVVDQRRSATALDGHLPWRLAQPVTARYVTFAAEANGWLMLSELRLLNAAGDNLLAGRRYTLVPGPVGALGTYPDDGRRLTDGQVAGQYGRETVVGWNDDEPRQITVDLGQPRAVQRVLTHTLAGGGAGVFLPAEVTVELSADGTTWSPAQRVTRPTVNEPGDQTQDAVFAWSAPPGATARWIRVTVRRGRGWGMVSEVAVE